MAKGDNLGEFEQLILTALMLLGENAYGMTTHEKVEELAEGRSISLGSVYTTLDRLEQKGYATSSFSDPTPERGGRAKRFFKITGSGEIALRNSMKVSANLVDGLRAAGGMA
jgi:PadR family transcriptional regulator, regulatory protein PadR